MFDELFSKGGLSLDRLRTLLEVEDAGSIADAAPGDPVRHSQYSRQLRELSEFFGCEVTKREGKRIKLTANGVQLAQLSREYLKGLNDFSARCHSQPIEISIAAGDSLIQWLVIPRLGPLIRQSPGIRFITQSLRTHEIIESIADLRVDFGIIRSDAMTSAMEAAELGAISYVAIVPRTLEEGKKAKLKDIFRLPFAYQETDGRFSRQLVEIAREAQPNFSPALACQSFPQTMAAVRSGYFAAVMPSLAAKEIDAAAVRKVHGQELDVLTRKVVLIWNRRLASLRPNTQAVAEKMRVAFTLL